MSEVDPTLDEPTSTSPKTPGDPGGRDLVPLELATESTRQYVDVVQRAHVIVIRGGGVTAYTSRAYSELRDGILHAYLDERVDSVVIRGEGKSFGAGGDLKEYLALLESGQDAMVKVDAEYARMPFRAALRCPKAIVCAVDGLCLGGGFALCLVSDVVIATRRSSFAAPEARVGMFEPYVMEFLPPVVGLSRARHLVATGESIDAETGERWGIVTVLVDGADDLEEHLGRVLRQISRGSPTARALYKRGMTAHVPDTDVLDNFRVALGHNGLEGLRAFRDKRSPEWAPLGADDLI